MTSNIIGLTERATEVFVLKVSLTIERTWCDNPLGSVQQGEEYSTNQALSQQPCRTASADLSLVVYSSLYTNPHVPRRNELAQVSDRKKGTVQRSTAHPRRAAMVGIRAAFCGSICLLVLLLSPALAAEPPAGGATATADSRNTKCGGVDIPYPFGISSGSCPVEPGFEVDCTDTGNGVRKPFVGNLEVISLQNGWARVMNHISSSCYNSTTEQMNPADQWILKLTGTPYRLSDSANKFTVVGCRTVAYIADQDDVGKYMSGCVSVCRRGELTGVANGTCSGIGCCQTEIAMDLDYYQVLFDVNMNTSGIYNRTPCSYAVLMESAKFTFSISYLTSPLEFNNTYGGEAPVVLDWAIRSASSCKDAEKNLKSYACKSHNSVCLDSSNGPGYICNCSTGYQGLLP
uniref:Wall-associated receptor kinase galacturonan-binding domain-containing protein n=1 Tax=Oryza brachyantha TaxID=4533 RepID=J3LX14_ORYBR